MRLREIGIVAVAACLFLQGCGLNKSTNPEGLPPDTTPFTDVQLSKLNAAIAAVNPQIAQLAQSLTQPLASPAPVEAIVRTVPNLQIINEGDTGGSAVFVRVGAGGPQYAIAWRAFGIASDTAVSVFDTSAPHDSAHGFAKRMENAIPKGPNVQLLAALSGDGFPNWLPKAQQVFAKAYANYTVNNTMASVDNLKAVTNTDVLVFYTHGIISKKAANRYLMATSSPFDPALYIEDIKNDRLAPVNVLLATYGAFKRLVTAKSDTSATMFGITEKFVNTYWTFNGNSLVIFDACWSASAGAAAFRAAVKASTVVGWTGQGDPTTCENSTLLLLDRMLGANCAKPIQQPFQRPFGRDDIVPLLTKYKCDQWYDPEYSMTSQIVFFPPSASTAQGILKPSIKRLVTDEPNKQLIIDGIFGDEQDKGSVTINGQERAIVSWSAKEIKCELQDNDAGKVKVVYADHASNPVMLTMWKLHITYTILGGGSLTAETIVDCPIRGDVHSFRNKPDEDVLREEVDILPTHAANATWTASGSSTLADEFWSGNGTSTMSYDAASVQNRAMTWGMLDPPDTTKFKFYANFLLMPGFLVTLKGDGAPAPFNYPVVLTDGLFNVDDMFQDPLKPYISGTFRMKNDFVLDAKYNIQAGSLTSNDAGWTVTFVWNAATAQFPPEPEWPH